ncbi:MAG: wax ester/triacylglycerol synthase domain-containing protein [Actinomycetota bacterium]
MTTPMRAVDAAFLAMERPSEPSHVGTLMIFGPSDEGPLTIDHVRSALVERLLMMPTARRVIDGDLGGLRRPWWRTVDRVDLDVHVRSLRLPADREPRGALHDAVAAAHAQRLDRRRPLWQILVIEGLGDDEVAVYAKVHLAAMDDSTGVDLMTALLDTERGPDPTMEHVTPRVEEVEPPSMAERVVGPVPDQIRRGLGFPVRLAGRAANAVGEQLPGLRETAAETARRTPGVGRLAGLLPPTEPGPGAIEHPTGRAPRLSFNEPIGPTRSYAASTLPTGDLIRLKELTGRSFHAVTLTVCAGAVRRWLTIKQELPSSPITAIVPVLVQGDRVGDANVSGLMVQLPTNVDDPMRRLELTAEAVARALDRDLGQSASLRQDIAMFAPPAVTGLAGRAMDLLPHRRYVSPTINLAITNVPGPRREVHLAGRPLRAAHPVLSLSETTPLSLGVQAGPGVVGLGAIADGERVPDLLALVDAARHELDELLFAAGDVID